MAGRYGNILSKNELAQKIQERVPANTIKATSYAVRVWDSWATYRNEASLGLEYEVEYPNIPLGDRLNSVSVLQLDDLFAYFIQEVRRADGKPYVPDSLRDIASGLQRHLKENLHMPKVNLLDKANEHFGKFRKALEARCRELTKEGVGVTKKQAQPISANQEKKLWDAGCLGMDNSVQLQNTNYFYLAKCFGFRAADEHRNLQREQFVFTEDEVGKYVQFNGRASKNFQGGQNQRYLQAKTTRQYEDPHNPNCAYNIIKLYCEYIPTAGSYYRKPLPGSPSSPIRYGAQPVGINTLRNCIKNMMQKIGENGYYTGHSVKVTCGTQLFDSKTDEQLIQHRTGHRSTASVRKYKRISCDTEKELSAKLDPPAPVQSLEGKYHEQVFLPSTKSYQHIPARTSGPASSQGVFPGETTCSPTIPYPQTPSRTFDHVASQGVFSGQGVFSQATDHEDVSFALNMTDDMDGDDVKTVLKKPQILPLKKRKLQGEYFSNHVDPQTNFKSSEEVKEINALMDLARQLSTPAPKNAGITTQVPVTYPPASKRTIPYASPTTSQVPITSPPKHFVRYTANTGKVPVTSPPATSKCFTPYASPNTMPTTSQVPITSPPKRFVRFVPYTTNIEKAKPKSTTQKRSAMAPNSQFKVKYHTREQYHKRRLPKQLKKDHFFMEVNYDIKPSTTNGEPSIDSSLYATNCDTTLKPTRIPAQFISPNNEVHTKPDEVPNWNSPVLSVNLYDLIPTNAQGSFGHIEGIGLVVEKTIGGAHRVSIKMRIDNTSDK